MDRPAWVLDLVPPSDPRPWRRALARRLSDLSEDRWSAGWHAGIEEVGLAAAAGSTAQFSEADGLSLRVLASLAGGWVEWGPTRLCLLDGPLTLAPFEGVVFVPWSGPSAAPEPA